MQRGPIFTLQPSFKELVGSALVTPARAYIRYAPIEWGKRRLWDRMGHRISRRTQEFVTSTVFGCRIAGHTQDLIQRYIYVFGIWEPNITRWINHRLRSGDTFIDVGANIGYFTLLASRLAGPHGRVVAIEASPTIFAQLRRNLGLNSIQNVRAVNIAISDVKGVAKLYRGPEWNIGQSTTLETPGLDFEGEVAAAPLSIVLRPEEIRTARLVKIDVEGTEWSALQGFVPILGATRSDLEIVCEILPEELARQGKTAEQVLRLMLSAGFYPYQLENNYSPSAYLPPHVWKRPERIRNGIHSECMAVFSRTDAAVLS